MNPFLTGGISALSELLAFASVLISLPRKFFSLFSTWSHDSTQVLSPQSFPRCVKCAYLVILEKPLFPSTLALIILNLIIHV